MPLRHRLKVRAARLDDVDDLVRLAKAAGAGLTNLPADPDALAERLHASEVELASSAAGGSRPIVFVLEADGRIAGSAMVLPRVGAEWPFYSYKINRLSQYSPSLKKTVTVQVLTQVNDYQGYAEVGGLVVDPELRGAAAGRVIARSRYLFMAEHREWFGSRVVAELRGVQDEHGGSPFWEAVGRRFYDMAFDEADRLNSLVGNQFIAELSPKYPIYVNVLPQDAQAVIGAPHKDSRRAYDLLIEEGFRDEDYVDIFDAGPTIHADLDSLIAVKESRRTIIGAVETLDGDDSLVCAGRAAAFRAGRGKVKVEADGLVVSPALADVLELKVGDEVRHVRF